MSPSGSAWSKVPSPFHSVSVLQNLSEPESAPLMGILLSVICLEACKKNNYNFSYMII